MKYSPQFMLAVCLVAACQPQSMQPTASQLTATMNTSHSLPAVSDQRETSRVSYPALEKRPAHGQLRLKGQQLTLSLELYPKSSEADFRTQLLDLSNATRLQATVTDSHGKSYTANGADGDGTVAYTGGTINLTFDNLVPDELLLVEVQAKNGLSHIVQADLATVLEHTTSSSPVNGTINFQTTVAAKAIKGLLQNGQQTRARAINLTGLHNLAERITGVSGTAPNLTYAEVHPTLVNTALLATDLVATNPIGLTESDYRRNGATVNLNVSGLNGADKVQVQITDAASAIQTDLGNGSTNITGLTPGSGLTAIVTPFGTPSQTYNYSINPTSLSLTEGNTTNLTITAAPTMTLTNISPANGPAGTAVIITGTGFTGTTAVAFNGTPAASFTVDSDTQITATVPSTATDGTISVTQGGTTKYSTDFNVYRRIYVNDDASGSNNGTSWTNAYTSLQTALIAASANDEIWVAAGTYKPTTDGNRNVMFLLKDQVNLYGGFNGTETLLSQRNISANSTILSGDLNDDDNYTTTPPGNISDNSQRIMQADDLTQQTTDGFVIQGGNSDTGGAGLEIGNSQITLENLTFKHNTSSARAGALKFRFANNITLRNSAFLNNTASKGAVLANSNSSNIAEMRNIVFKGNKDTTDHGGLIELQSTKIDATWENLIFIDNNSQGRAIYANIYNPDNSNVTFTLKNVLIANNTLHSKAINVYGDNTGTFIGHNITLANNSCPDQGSGFCDSASSLTNTTMNNWLYWKDSVSLSGTGSNNITLGSGGTPFIDSADPDGPDNIFFTADDGYNLAAGNAGIDAGNTNAGVPDKDIANQDRVGDTDAGAYESQTPAAPPASNFTITGTAPNERLGHSVAGAGDINNDGFDDFIAGAYATDNSTGKTYVIFGGTNVASSGSINLSSLNGTNGFVLNGEAVGDQSGYNVSGAGDVNNDGFADLLIGAQGANGSTGKTYVIFGGTNVGSSGSINLSSLNGTNGFVLNGEAADDQSGINISAAGDVNNDGIDDLIIGAFNANGFAGKSYVVFGSTNLGSSGSINLSSLNGSNGFDINGVNAYDASGGSVSRAGDVNNDGVDDLIIGAYGPNSYAGKSYVIFGGTGIGSSGSINLSSLNGTNGFSLSGEGANHYSGISVSSAGDINNDGFDDLMVGAYGFNSFAGKGYIIFGGSNVGSSGNINLSSLNGSNGFSLSGENPGDYLGLSVSSAGDLNNDGFDDLMVGASSFNSGVGKSYVIFGSTNVGSSGSINLSSLNGTNGFALNGEAAGDQSGISLSGAGDLNNDGFADFLVGAFSKNSFAGKVYTVFGAATIGSSGSINLSDVGN